jgi:hypothetical protein
MISKFDLAKALRNQAVIVTDANSLRLVGNGESFSPDVNESHVEEIVLYGDDNTVGVGNDSSDVQVGIYQLSAHTPIAQQKWAGLSIVDILAASFTKGLKLTFNSQLVIIMESSIAQMMTNDTHNIHHLSVRFSVIN